MRNSVIAIGHECTFSLRQFSIICDFVSVVSYAILQCIRETRILQAISCLCSFRSCTAENVSQG